MIRSTFLFIALGAIATIGCKPPSKVLILQREWTANAEFAGDVSAEQSAPSYGIKIEVHEGSETVDPVKMVRSGQAQFGVASADRILQENQGGAGLVVLAAATCRSPVVFLTKKSLNIQKPAEFGGHTIGLQPGTNTELVFQVLAKANGLPSADLKIVDSGWGTQTFETGTIDVLGAFAYDEPVTLTLKNIPFGVISPEDYGVQFVGTVYFTRKDMIDKDPALVQSFINALVAGWKTALANPEASIQLLSQRFQSVQANQKKEIKSLEMGKAYFQGEEGNLLYSSKSRWEAMGKSLIDIGKLKEFRFADNVDYRFLEKAW